MQGKSSRGVRTDDIVTSVQPWKVYLDYIDTCGYHNIIAAMVCNVTLQLLCFILLCVLGGILWYLYITVMLVLCDSH